VSKSNTDRIYFDSCVYLGHYRNEELTYGKPLINAIQHVMSEAVAGNISIVTSSVTICEVITRLKSDGLKKEIEEFKNLFKFGIHELHDFDPKIAEQAAEYRSHYAAHPVAAPGCLDSKGHQVFVSNLTTFDAAQLATAVRYQCDEFWTMDGLRQKVDGHKSVKPLWLGNMVAADPLIITAPSTPQGVLLHVPRQAKPSN